MVLKLTARANFSGVFSKPGARISITCGIRNMTDEREGHQGRQQQRQRMARETLRGFLAVALALGGVKRHEGGREGALGEQAAKQIGQALRDEERIRHGTRAQKHGRQRVAHETRHPAYDGQAADGEKGARESHFRKVAPLRTKRKPRARSTKPAQKEIPCRRRRAATACRSPHP